LPLKAFEEDDSTEPVTLILNSSGGSVSDGFFLAYYLS
jgi:ATP-dependent protease ClpP protease subunit